MICYSYDMQNGIFIIKIILNNYLYTHQIFGKNA